MTFMLSEDKALRELLTGLTVTDQKSATEEVPRPVGVWFGQPDQELRAQNYPYITIDLIDVQQDFQREMRGLTSAEYLRPESLDEDDKWETGLPIPVNLMYQITTYSRHPRQDRELISKVLYSRLPFRFGTLSTDDNTVRRLDVLDVTKRDIPEQAKRLFMNAITVRVSSEIPLSVFKQLYTVTSVYVDPPTEVRAVYIKGKPTFEGNSPSIVIVP